MGHVLFRELMQGSQFYLVNIAEPFGYILKALGIRYIIYEHYAHRSPVIGRCNSVKPFLTSGVPEKKTMIHLQYL